MRASDVLLSILIMVVFFSLAIFGLVGAYQEKIKQNWPEYKCDPMVIPLAGQLGPTVNGKPVSVAGNFMECIQSIQTDYTKFLMEPIFMLFQMLMAITASIAEMIGGLLSFFGNFRKMIGGYIGTIFGSFQTIIIMVQKMILKLLDIIRRIYGIGGALMYIGTSFKYTVMSLTNSAADVVVNMDPFNVSGQGAFTGLGPLKKDVTDRWKDKREDSSMCFHPHTKVALKNGEIKKMKDIKLGDILEDDSIVEATMKIKNTDQADKQREKLYEIENGCNGEKIYITGSHYIYDSTVGKFIKVQDYSGAKVTNKKSKLLSCLITNTHKIPVGEQTFWDWEDDKIPNN